MSHLEENLIEPVTEKSTMKIFGVGDAGVRWLGQLGAAEFSAAEMVAVNTDAASLAASDAPVKFHIANKLLRGLGSGGDAERSRALAEEQFSTLKSACAGAGVVFILAGLGGGAGSGMVPVLARAAREAGALVLALVSLPFAGEGDHRQRQAQQSLEQIKSAADGVICLAGEKIFGLIDENTGLLEIFRSADLLLLEGLRGVWQLLTRRGIIQVHFGELCALLRDRHAENCFAFVEATGAARSRTVVEKILSHPLLDKGRALGEADVIIVNFTGGSNLTMSEINRIMGEVKRQCGRATVVMGAAVEEALGDRLCVTIIAGRSNGSAKSEEAPRPASARGNNFSGVPTSPAALPVFGGNRSRRAVGKPVQGQLSLTIVSKGRFDKSEPTLHDGKDLDVPTFLRLGLVLN